MADMKSLRELTQRFLCLNLHAKWELITVKTKLGESGNYWPTHQTVGDLSATLKSLKVLL